MVDKITKSRNHEITKPRNHETTKPRNHETTKPRNHETTKPRIMVNLAEFLKSVGDSEHDIPVMKALKRKALRKSYTRCREPGNLAEVVNTTPQLTQCLQTSSFLLVRSFRYGLEEP